MMKQGTSNSQEINGIWKTADGYETHNIQTICNTQASDQSRAVNNRGMEALANGSRPVQTRRVGSVTFGITMVCYGILFLAHIFMPVLRYSFIFRCWPVIFILLGGEILIENYKCRRKDWKMVYDFPAVLMLGAMLLFAMIMAATDYAMYYEANYGAVFF